MKNKKTHIYKKNQKHIDEQPIEREHPDNTNVLFHDKYFKNISNDFIEFDNAFRKIFDEFDNMFKYHNEKE